MITLHLITHHLMTIRRDEPSYETAQISLGGFALRSKHDLKIACNLTKTCYNNRLFGV
ncbi:hypothetical protein [Moraxella lacunata]|uniref:hypothetical protein n=1 Tax=Moraxella lacunata TaxID=477 RepID=UPI003EE1A3E4